MESKIKQILKQARGCETRGEFKKKYLESYKYLYKMNRLDVLEREFPFVKKWKISELEREIEKYDSLKDFYKNSSGAYRKCLQHPRLSKKLKSLERRRKSWRVEDIKKVAKEYRSRWNFSIGDKGAYEKAIRLGILDEICKHMENEPFKRKDLKVAAKECRGKRSILMEKNRRLYEWGRREEKELFDKLFPTNYKRKKIGLQQK